MPNRKESTPRTQAFASVMRDVLARRSNLNEQSFAALLHVAPGTVTKWMEGKSLPSLPHLSALLGTQKLALGAAEQDCFIEAWLSDHGASKDGIRMIMAREQLAMAMAERDLLRRMAECHKCIEVLDRDLFVLMSAALAPTDSGPLRDQAAAFIFNVFSMACRFFGANDVYRACIYIPDSHDPNFLVISPWESVGSVSRRANRCYCGPDPAPPGAKRGTPGTVWFKGQSKCTPDVSDDDDFAEFHDPPRPKRPYKSLAQTLITAPEDGRKLGVFCLDSETYAFQPHDLALMELFAARLGRVLAVIDPPGVSGYPSNRVPSATHTHNISPT